MSEGQREQLSSIFGDSTIVALEFDGVIRERTSLLDLERTSAHVLASLVAQGWALGLSALGSADPYELLRNLDAYSSEVSYAADQLLTHRELGASSTARRVPSALLLVESLQEKGKKVAIVGDTSTAAITLYLKEHGLDSMVDALVGRPQSISHMFPKPHPFVTVTHKLGGGGPDSMVFVGSTRNGVRAASKFGVPTIGFSADGREMRSIASGGAVCTVVELIELFSALDVSNVVERLSSEERSLLRRNELLRQTSLTNAEMDELCKITDDWRNAGNTNSYGFLDVNTAYANIAMLAHSRRKAANENLILEVLAATAILIEMQMRVWLCAVKGKEFGDGERLTLGQFVKLVKAAGFDEKLVNRLEAFTETRNIGIHRIISGERDYRALGLSFMEDPSIYEDVEEWVSSELPAV